MGYFKLNLSEFYDTVRCSNGLKRLVDNVRLAEFIIYNAVFYSCKNIGDVLVIISLVLYMQNKSTKVK